MSNRRAKASPGIKEAPKSVSVAADTGKRQSEIDAAMTRLTLACSDLEAKLSLLGERLMPVFVPSAGIERTVDAEMTFSPLGKAIDEAASRIADQSGHVESFLQSLGL